MFICLGFSDYWAQGGGLFWDSQILLPTIWSYDFYLGLAIFTANNSSNSQL